MKTKMKTETRTWAGRLARLALTLALGLMLSPATTHANITYLVTFEGEGHGTYIAPDTDHYIPGTPIRFAPPWRTFVAGPWGNNPSPPTIAGWTDADYPHSVEVTFDRPVAGVAFSYSSYPPVAIQAFDAQSNLLGSAAGLGTAQNGFYVWDSIHLDLGVDLITRVLIHGGRARTAIDDFSVSHHPVAARAGSGH